MAFHLANDAATPLSFFAGENFDINNLFKEIAPWSGNVIISSEEFSSLSYRLNTLQMLHDMFYNNGWKPVIICYLRNQIDFFNAFYAQNIQNMESEESIDDFLARVVEEQRYHYWDWLKGWYAVFGDNVIIRPYEREQLIGGSTVNDILDILDALPAIKQFSGVPPTNPRPTNVEVALCRRFARVIGPKTDQKERQALKLKAREFLTSCDFSESKKYWGIGEEKRSELHQVYWDSNVKLAKKCFNRSWLFLNPMGESQEKNDLGFDDLDDVQRRDAEKFLRTLEESREDTGSTA